MRPIFPCLALLLTTLLSAACRAQEAAPPTLASALAQAAPPVGGLALAVAADKITLPQDAPPLPGVGVPGATVPQVAAAFGRVTQDFGDVTAVAPPITPLLNPDPHDPNVYDGMEPRDVFTLLAASLDDTQWAALSGKGGLGLGDLASENQRQLFAALFPGGKLTIHQTMGNSDIAQAYVTAAAAGLGPEQAGTQFTAQEEASGRDVSAELPQVRLRLGHRTLLSLPVSDRPEGVTGAFGAEDPAAAPHWEVLSDPFKPKDTLYGVAVRVDAPNAPKDGQLDFDLPALQTPVPVAPWRTVGSLVAAIGRATRVEIYADKRWESKTLTTVSGTRAQPARNLLRALALCLGGTYRKVGPAYVLTYDVVGAGTIRQRWAEFDSDAYVIKRTPLDDARTHISASHSFQELTQTDDPLEPTADQRKAGDPARGRYPLSFAQLTPGQQGFVRRYIAQQQDWHDKELAFIQQNPAYKEIGFPFDTQVPTTQGQFSLIVTPQLQLLLPSVQGPVDSNVHLSRFNLFTLSTTDPKPPTTPDPFKPAASAPPSVPPAAALAAIPRRAVLAHPRTAAAVDALVAAMRKAHMNALYLDVFSGGVSHLDGSPDILDEALTKTRGTGIAVLPTLNLFGWGDGAPASAPDLNILGETSTEAVTRQQAREALTPPSPNAPPPPPAAGPPLFVSPTAPDVGQTLAGLVQGLAARPGVAGLVWQDATPPGYAPDDGMGGTDLGYTEADRLAFLRRTHVDPVDVSFPVYIGANLTLADFDGDGADGALQSQWQAARVVGQRALLQSLLMAARPLAVFVERKNDAFGGADWYGSWDGPRSSLPAYRYDYPNVTPADAQAKAQSRLALLALSPEFLLGPDAGAFIQAEFHQVRWDGFVLDADAPRPDVKKAPPSLEEALAEMAK